MAAIVRLRALTLENFKNVRYGELGFENPHAGFSASILGLYGQNGSGKTALIDCIQLLKQVFSGRTVPHDFIDCINVGAEKATIRCELSVRDSDEEDAAETRVWYRVSLSRIRCVTARNTDILDPTLAGFGEEREPECPMLSDEVLEYAPVRGGRVERRLTLFDTRGKEVISPAALRRALTGGDRGRAADLLVGRRLAESGARSFLFSAELLSLLRSAVGDEARIAKGLALTEALAAYGNWGLFVIRVEETAMISMDTLPLSYRLSGSGRDAGRILLSLTRPSVIREEGKELVGRVLSGINAVLGQLIPGLSVGMRDLGPQLLKNGEVGRVIELLSVREGRDLPLRCESEGIRKIISVLQLLISMYNHPGVTVAIDELDAGVFEYLLGEILRIVSEHGQGQLVFTSHNLRPLETIDRGFLAFTTSNPDHRYIRLSHVRQGNNLRDFYYRDILLGEQSEPVSTPTDSFRIAMAFREAGEKSGS